MRLKKTFMDFDQGSLDIIICICMYICICVYFVGRDTEWLWGGGGRESMRYLVEQAFPLRQCELQHLKHSSFSWDKTMKTFDKYISIFRRIHFKNLNKLSHSVSVSYNISSTPYSSGTRQWKLLTNTFLKLERYISILRQILFKILKSFPTQAMWVTQSQALLIPIIFFSP